MSDYAIPHRSAGFSRREFREWMHKCARHAEGHRRGMHRMGFGRGGRAGRGDIRAAILALLAEQPMHGYQIMRELTERSGGVWQPSPGSVYPTLQQLADEGLVTSEDVDGRRVYTLTDEGKTAAAAGPGSPWGDARHEAGTDVRHLARQVAEAAMQVQRVGSPNAAIAAQVILIDTRAKLYGLLAGDSQSGAPADDASDDEA